MLRSFRVGNHRSIREEAELLLIPAYDKERPVVPVAALFGANASGKSNLLDALRWMQAAVRDSFGSWSVTAGVPRLPFLLDRAAATLPSLFVVELMIDEVRHTYGFAVDDERVLEEWLYSYPHNRKRVVFERVGDEWTFGNSVVRAKVDVLRDLTRQNTLFLSVAGRSEVDAARPAFDWFERSPLFSDPRGEFDANSVGQFIGRSKQHQQSLVELVRAADLGIRDIRLQPDPLRTSGSDVVFVHGDSQVVLKAGDQSHGTLASLRLLTAALTALEHGLVLCVDEIDASLHPMLTARLIELFRHVQTNPRQAQLIFTTHDATLLGSSFGEDILARDEVWFMEKGADGGSTLFALSDFHPRKEENTERRYLGGSYGAVPAVSEYEFRNAMPKAA